MQYPNLLLSLCMCTITLACKRPGPIHLEPTIEEPPELASTLRSADATAPRQLIRGFYGLEQNTWRWTAPRFTVILGTPPAAVKSGAVLFLKFNLPDQIIGALKSITIVAKAGGAVLSPQTFTAAGAHEYRREIPASAFTTDNIQVDFSLDKFLKPPGESRELGLAVTAVGLERK